jgi:hypothetical protein
MEFSTDAEYKAHKESGHTLPGTPLPGPDGNPVAVPSPDFIEAVERIKKQGEIQQLPEAVPNNSPIPAPIRLTYLYTGHCPDCNLVVNTLELDLTVGKTKEQVHVVAAFCPNCKKQIESREVQRL